MIQDIISYSVYIQITRDGTSISISLNSVFIFGTELGCRHYNILSWILTYYEQSTKSEPRTYLNNLLRVIGKKI